MADEPTVSHLGGAPAPQDAQEVIRGGIWCPTMGAGEVYAAERALDELVAERDRLRAALEEIAGEAYWSGGQWASYIALAALARLSEAERATKGAS